MLFHPRSTLSSIGAICLFASLSACADSPFGQSLEDSLAVDPQLQEESTPAQPTPTPTPATTPATTPTPTPTPTTEVSLPDDFPGEIPRYEGASLETVTIAETPDDPVVTRWTSEDSIEEIEGFYQERLGKDNWQRVTPETQESIEETADGASVIVARRDGMQVQVSIAPNPDEGDGKTAFDIAYFLTGDETATSPEPAADGSSLSEASPTPSIAATPSNAPTNPPKAFSDLDRTPQARSYIEDLAALGVLTASDDSDRFAPDETITRREYARWLLDTNNTLYADAPAKQIRPVTSGAQPVFGDIPATDPDFGTIQGLAEAGIVPSRLTGATTIAQFRPDAPLTREELVLWKVPLDLRRGLPAATLDAVRETWGFQDAASIEAKALKAVLADFQNGDLANIRRAFGYTTLFQPKKAVTRSEAASTLWYFGFQGDGRSAALAVRENNEQ